MEEEKKIKYMLRNKRNHNNINDKSSKYTQIIYFYSIRYFKIQIQ